MPMFIPGPATFSRGARIALVVFTLVLVAAAALFDSREPVAPAPAEAVAGRAVSADWAGFQRTGDLRHLAPTSSLAGTTDRGR